jgi:hypothetical protein
MDAYNLIKLKMVRGESFEIAQRLPMRLFKRTLKTGGHFPAFVYLINYYKL